MRSSPNQPIRLWQSLAACAFMFLLAAPAQASIQEIRVLATGVDRSSVRANELALSYAKQRAVYLAARKLQVQDAGERVAALKPDQWKEIVRGATVLQTRREGEITYADVTVSVVMEALRRALDLPEVVPPAIDPAAVSHGVLVLPVFIGKDRPYLWEKDNLSSAPVRDEILRQSRGTVLAAAGDVEDRRLVDYQNALEVTGEELAPMFKRYGIDEIIIAITTPSAPGTPDPTAVLLRRLVPSGKGRVEEITLPPQSEKDTLGQRVAQAAEAIAAAATQIAGSTSGLQQAKMTDAPSLPIRFRYATARDLATMQEAVRTAPGVLQLVMPAIALEDMSGVVYLSGEREAVRQYLVKKGFILSDTGEGWTIALR